MVCKISVRPLPMGPANPRISPFNRVENATFYDRSLESMGQEGELARQMSVSYSSAPKLLGTAGAVGRQAAPLRIRESDSTR